VLVIFVGFDISTPKYDHFHLFIPWRLALLGQNESVFCMLNINKYVISC